MEKLSVVAEHTANIARNESLIKFTTMARK